MSDHCRWDREREEYLRDGEPCKRDDYGDPTHHCTARRTCANHIGHGELTCARCVGRTRTDVRVIVARSVELMPAAIYEGVTSEVAMLAGPACDYRVFSARRNLDKQWIQVNIPHRHRLRAFKNLIPDDDEHHPYGVLTRWAMMLAEDYGHDLPAVLTIENAGAYLDRVLPRIAQDPEQDFPLFAREIRKCRSHLELVLRDSQEPERGAPCPDCGAKGQVVRLTRDYGHWCTAEDCDRINYADETGDRWVCPADRDHWMTAEGYAEWLRERTEARRIAVP